MEARGTGPAILIAAASGRALASVARRAGYQPLVADFYDDADTRSLCAATCRTGNPHAGFEAESLMAALDRLAAAAPPAGFVYGAGFEDRVELLDRAASRWPLFGNGAEAVRRVKDPHDLAALCASVGVAHPEISFTPPPLPEGWLVKSVGGAGGGHVAPAGAWRADNENIYFQCVAPGDPVSILCLCAGTEAVVLGSSRQWASPGPNEPFRFGGCVRPAVLACGVEQQLSDAATALAAASRLIGLVSFDFLVAGEVFTLIEINPRPGSTLDIFEDREGVLFQAHIDACRGVLPATPLRFEGAAAAAVVYAWRDIAAMPAFEWPAWMADRSAPGSAIGLYDPLCTVKACAADPASARALVEERTACLVDRLDHLDKEERLERDRAEHQFADGRPC